LRSLVELTKPRKRRTEDSHATPVYRYEDQD
jgi:hypothetical protein